MTMVTGSNTVKKRIQFSTDEGTAKSAEYIIRKAGLSPATVVSMVYSEIANTGKIPVNLQSTKEDLAKANIIRASYDLPNVKLDNDQAINDFFDDDGGY